MSAPRGKLAAQPVRASARGVALKALVAVEAGARANVVVPELLAGAGLEARDRAMVTEMVYGSCRMQRACDWLVDRHARGRLDAEIRSATRMGAYQLGWMRVPSHAAVSATVAEVAGPGRGLVNAVLRKVAADVDSGSMRWPDPATELSYPDWMVALLAHDLGPGPARAAMEVMNQAGAVTTRSDGYIQDAGSQMVVDHLGVAADERILDLCAAPGGKATGLAGCAGGDGAPGLVVAADLSPGRAATIAANVAGLGLGNVATVVADGTRPPWRPGGFDRVLVDAPCSGLGVLRRRPDARWRIQPGDLPRLAELQRRLLTAAVAMVRPGGILAYSVCTLSLTETAAIDRWLAETFPQLTPMAPPASPWRRAGRGGLLLPQTAGTDGMYLLVLRVPG